MWNFKLFSHNFAAIEDNGKAISYEQLSSECVNFSRQIAKRSLVFCLCSNSIGSLIGYVASILSHNPILLLDNQIDKDLLQHLVEVYKPDYLWCPQTKHFIQFQQQYTTFDYCLLKTDYCAEYPIYKNLALLLTTSGSLGSPKLVRISYDNLKANTDSIIDYLKLNDSERPISTLPMNYTYGLSIINTHLKVGATLLLTEKSIMQKEFWNFMISHKATSFGGVPYTYEMLNKLRFYRRDLPDLKTMTQAGGKLNPKLHKEFAEYAKETNKQFIVMYGQTEATSRMGYLPAAKSLDKIGAMGVAIPKGRFELIDEHGAIVNKPNIVGELVYYGKNVSLGYAQCGNDLIKEDERCGRLATGDLAKFDEDGFYYIVGRSKRFLKIYGNRVSLDETEFLLEKYFPQIECACCGYDDHMYVFITNESLSKDIKELLVNKTNLNPKAFNIMYINDIPKNGFGKTLYKDLEKLFSYDY